MKVRRSRIVLSALALALLAPLAAQGAPVPVEVKLDSLRCVQTYALDVKAEDQAYAVVGGIARGQEVQLRIPKEGTLPAAPKKTPVEEPVSLWSGELDNGEFAQLTVTVFQAPEGGTAGDPAVTKSFLDTLANATKALPARAKKTLTADEAKALAADTLKAHRDVVTKATNKESGMLGRAKGTDHFNGMFTVTLWNDGGKIGKRLDPVGLTFGEHYGNDVKIYSKLKYTRNNVLVKDEGGQFFPQQLTPVSEDKNKVRVKMLETEFQKNAKGKLVRNVTDYLAEVSVTAGGQPLLWALGGEQPGPGPLHTYWNFAE